MRRFVPVCVLNHVAALAAFLAAPLAAWVCLCIALPEARAQTTLSATFEVTTVPEIDATALASAISLLVGSLALLERRRA
jgi:hypothetical protein